MGGKIFFWVTIFYFHGCPVVKTLPSSAESVGLIPGWGAKILHASWPKKQNINQEQYYNKLNKNGPPQNNLLKKKG